MIDLLEAARKLCAEAEEYEFADGIMLAAPIDIWHALMDAIEAAEKAEPAAYRVECRWTAPTLDQTWRKYSDCVSRCAAGTVRERVANSGDMESRIVPLYAGEPEEPR